MTDTGKNKTREMTDSEEKLNPLTDFVYAVMDELRKRLSPKEFAELLRECEVVSENEGTGADTKSTPRQTPFPAD